MLTLWSPQAHTIRPTIYSITTCCCRAPSRCPHAPQQQLAATMSAASALQLRCQCSSRPVIRPRSSSRKLRRSSSVRCQAQQPQQQQRQRPIEVSRSIAAARAQEAARPDALFGDPYAAVLAGHASASSSSDEGAVRDVITTRYIDESLINAMGATAVNRIQDGDFRQVVLLGDGMDTRPFRLPWPPGTLLFVVAPAEVHEQAEALLAGAQPPAHAPRGCLLRRVNMNAAAVAAAADDADAGVGGAAATAAALGGNGSSSSSSDAATTSSKPLNTSSSSSSCSSASSASSSIFMDQLERAGFRGDRLSVWALQGLHGQGLRRGQLRALLAEVAHCACYHSLLVGELPAVRPGGTARDADNALAEAGLLGMVVSHADADASSGYGRWAGDACDAQAVADAGAAAGRCSGGGSDGEAGGGRWLCVAQQQRLSLAQMGVYEAWSAEYESADVGDDVIGNFS